MDGKKFTAAVCGESERAQEQDESKGGFAEKNRGICVFRLKSVRAWYYLSHPNGGLAELVDALDSKSSTYVCGFESHSRYFLEQNTVPTGIVFFLFPSSPILPRCAFGFFFVGMDLQGELDVFAIGGGFHHAADRRGSKAVSADE